MQQRWLLAQVARVCSLPIDVSSHASFLHQTCRYLLVVFTTNNPSVSIHNSARATPAEPSTRFDEYAHVSPLTPRLLLSAYGGDHHPAHSVNAVSLSFQVREACQS